jgi:hypothetical protein
MSGLRRHSASVYMQADIPPYKTWRPLAGQRWHQLEHSMMQLLTHEMCLGALSNVSMRKGLFKAACKASASGNRYRYGIPAQQHTVAQCPKHLRRAARSILRPALQAQAANHFESANESANILLCTTAMIAVCPHHAPCIMPVHRVHSGSCGHCRPFC